MNLLGDSMGQKLQGLSHSEKFLDITPQKIHKINRTLKLKTSVF